MKSKFGGLNFESVEVLTQEEKQKVKGGYGGSGGGGGCATKSCTYVANPSDTTGPIRYQTSTCSSTQLMGKTCLWVCPGPSSCF